MITKGKIHEFFKIGGGLAPVSLATTNSTGNFFQAGYRNLVIIKAATMAAAKTVVAQIRKATSNIGAGAVDYTEGTVTITALTEASIIDILVNAPANGKTVIINGITYTTAGAYSLANREFSTDAELITLINAVDPTLYAVAGAATHLTVYPRDFGKLAITVGGVPEVAKLVAQNLAAFAFIEFGASDLGKTGTTPYTHFAVKVTTNDTIVTDVTVIIDDPNFTIPVDQKPAASTVID